MIQRILNSKNFLAVLLAMLTGTLLYFKLPWPMTNGVAPLTWNEYFLRLIALRDPWTYAGLKACYHIMLFTTPFIGYSFLLSALYIFTLRPGRTLKPQSLPPYPSIANRNELYVVVGEIHHPRKPVPAENPYWLTIPARGLFTGTIIIGATGSGKTAAAMYPITEQLLGYKAGTTDERLGGIILEVKGDFCGKVRTILRDHGRETMPAKVRLPPPSPKANVKPPTTIATSARPLAMVPVNACCRTFTAFSQGELPCPKTSVAHAKATPMTTATFCPALRSFLNFHDPCSDIFCALLLSGS